MNARNIAAAKQPAQRETRKQQAHHRCGSTHPRIGLSINCQPTKRKRVPAKGRQPIMFTTLDDVYPSSPDDLTRYALCFSELAARIKAPLEFVAKESMPLLKLGIFGCVPSPKGYYRHDGNVTGVSGLEGDYDLEVLTMAEAAARLRTAGVQAIFYTSPSHNPARPRWRVLCPFSVLYEGNEARLRKLRTAQMERLQGALGKDCPLSTESWTLSQTYYVGRKLGAEYECIVVEGKAIDTIALLPRLGKLSGVRADKRGHVTKLYDDTFGVNVLGRVRTMLVGETFHQELLSITASFAGRGLPRDLAEDFLFAVYKLSDARREDHPRHARWKSLYAEIGVAVRTAYDKYKSKPLSPRRRNHWSRVLKRRAAG